MLGFYDYTVILTYLSLISSSTGILALSIGVRDYRFGILCLMISGILDLFDGPVARTKKNRTKEEKINGIQLDSFSDLVAFGILPAVILVKVACDSKLIFLHIFIGVAYTAMAVARLSYFNVIEEIRQECESDNRKLFDGLPVTTSAIIIPIIYLFFKNNYIFYDVSLLILGTLFISKIKIKKPQICVKK